MWRDFYYIELYHDTDHRLGTITFEEHEEYKLEEQARNYYKQLRAMGARGEIRIYFCSRENRRGKAKQVAFVSLYDSTFTYERTP